MKAQSLFSTLKKKYARKKKDRKAADVSGTSTEAVAKAQKALQPYDFLQWLNGFIQTRQGRSNLPNRGQNPDEEQEEEEEEVEEEQFSYEYEDNELSPATVTHEKDPSDVVEQNDQPLVKSATRAAGNKINNKQYSKQKRAGIKGSARESLMEDMEFSLIRDLQEKVGKKRKAEDTIIEESSEDLFCKSLAADLKELPHYEKCMAKQEIRSVVCKYQMTAMNKQQQNLIPKTPVQVESEQQSSQYGFMQFNQSPFNRFSATSSMTSPPATPRSWTETINEKDSFH